MKGVHKKTNYLDSAGILEILYWLVQLNDFGHHTLSTTISTSKLSNKTDDSQQGRR